MALLTSYPRVTDPFKTGVHSGLNFAYGVGNVRVDNVVIDVEAGTVVLSDDATNYIELTISGGIVANSTGFSVDRIPLYAVVTSSGAIATVIDKRSFISYGGGGSGGSGTAALTTYDNTTSGIPAYNVQDAIDALAIQGDWITATLSNGWVIYGAEAQYTPRYFKDTLGFVHLIGRVSSGSSTIFTLPVGYRPISTIVYPAIESISALVESTGIVRVYTGGNSSVWLHTISFRAV